MATSSVPAKPSPGLHGGSSHTPMSLPATSLLSFLTQAYTGSGYVVGLGVDLLNQGILDAWLAKLQVNPLNTDYGLLCC